MPKRPTTQHIAPKLASGLRRARNAHAIPEHVKHALKMIAWSRGESVSWVLEQVIYSHFRLEPPKYLGTRAADLDITAPAKLKYPRSA